MSQPRNWFGEWGTYRGFEWYQIDPKLFQKVVTHAHLGPIWYFSKSSDVPYSPNQFLDFFPTSYSKPALVINLGTAATSSQRSPSGSQLLHHWRSTGYTTYMTFIFDFLLQPWYDFQYIITLCPLFFIVSSVTILMIMIYFFYFIQ